MPLIKNEVKRVNRKVMARALNALNSTKPYRSASLLELSSRPRRGKEVKIGHCLRESLIKERTGG